MTRTRIPAKRSKPRRGPMRDRGYMDWLKDRVCIACLVQYAPDASRFLIDPAHTTNNGRGSKGPDNSCIPLCRHHHDEMDGRLSTAITTKAAFAAKYQINLELEAAAHWAAYEGRYERNQTGRYL